MTAREQHPLAPGGADGIAGELLDVGLADATEVGRGGFGVVYRCSQPTLDRVVAVKVLSGDLDHERLERFLREQRAMGSVSGHPHICNVLQVGTTPTGRPYLVMPFHRRGSLQELIRRGGPLPWPEVLHLGVKVAGALETAHRSGTLHRDVKPANILLTEYGDPQLTDFGIARTDGVFDTSAGRAIGSPAFTAPEVLEGDPPSVAADVYGLGATLFCALTGHAAFERRDGEQVVAQFLRVTDQPVPDLHRDDIPADVGAVIESAMATDPIDRPATAADLGIRLRDLAAAHGLGAVEMALPETPRAPEADHTRRVTVPRRSAGTARSTESRVRSRTHRPGSLTPPAPATRFRPSVAGRALVTRGRLLDLLRAGDRRRLVVIHAPAGYGKSTLAAQWAAALTADAVTVAWLSVAPDDNNVLWFLSHLLESVRRAAPDLTEDLEQVLEDDGYEARTYLMTMLLNRIHDTGHRVTLVIDDWHRVSSPDSVEALEYLLDNGCHHLQLVVTSRNNTSLPLSRMRVQDELVDIDSTALRFDEKESQDMLVGVGGLRLSDSDVADLWRSTEGWAAALQLASLSLRGRDRPEALIEHLADHHAVGDFLAENVLDALEPALLDFLLTTSVTERITGSLASALTGVPHGQTRLEEVAARDLFLLPVGDERAAGTGPGTADTWYRYHHLFVKYLRRRLNRDHPERVPALHRTASAWFADRNLLPEAVDHALRAGDTESAVGLVVRGGIDVIEHSRMITLLGLVDKLPPTAIVGQPRLQLMLAWSNVLLQRTDRSKRALMLVRAALETAPDPRLSTEADVIEGVVAGFSDHAVGVEHFGQRCIENPEQHSPWVVATAAISQIFAALYRFDFDGVRRWQDWAAPYHRAMAGPLATMYTYCLAGVAASEQLDLDYAEDRFRRGLRVAQELSGPNSHSARLAAALLGGLMYERNNLPEAERLLDQGFELGGEGGLVEFMIASYATGARIKARRGDPASAAQRLAEGARTANALDLPRLRARIDNERVQLGFPTATGDRSPRYLTRPPVDAVPDGIAEITAQLEDSSTARILAGIGTGPNTDQACRIARAWVDRLAGTGRARARLQADRLLTVCLFAARRDEQALAVLADVAAKCARHGIPRFLLDGGPAVVAGLTTLRAAAASDDWDPAWPVVPATFLDDVLATAATDS